MRPAGRFIQVSQARELERETSFRPYEGRRRVFLIDEADKLNEASSNALLKTLEEVPQTAHLILLTARPASLLPTVRSRCQVVRFTPLKIDEVEAYLATERAGGHSAADRKLVARLARGSLGRALAIDVEKYRAQREGMLMVLRALSEATDRARLLRQAEELTDAKRKDEYEPGLEVLETLAHDVWLLSISGAEADIINEDVRDQLTRASAHTSSHRAAEWLRHIEELRSQLAVNINRKVATDALFLRMAAKPKSLS